MKFEALPKNKKIFVILSPLLCLAVFLALYFTFGSRLLEIVSNRAEFKEWLNAFPIPANAVFVFLRAFQTVIKIIPAEPLEIGSGYIWGTLGGFFYCMLGTEIGSLVILLFTKIYGVRFVNLFADTGKLNEWSFIKDSKKKYLLLFIIYIIPGTPKDIITYFIGLTDTRIAPFLIITGIARIPAIISSTWCGSTLIDKNYGGFIAVFAVITAVSAAGTFFGMKYISRLKENKQLK